MRGGTIHAIVGENGAGKSTAMRIAYGFYTADNGDVVVDGGQVPGVELHGDARGHRRPANGVEQRGAVGDLDAAAGIDGNERLVWRTSFKAQHKAMRRTRCRVGNHVRKTFVGSDEEIEVNGNRALGRCWRN